MIPHDTPFLALEADAFERNVARLADVVIGRHRKRWRPHIKGLRAAEAARALLAAGACGVTCSTVGEAEAMVAAGVAEVLVANQVVGAGACARLAGLNRGARVLSAVDNPAQLPGLAAAAQTAGVVLPLLVELDVGLARCGCAGIDEVLHLARQIAAVPGLRFEGLTAWEGHTVRIADPASKAAAVAAALGKLQEAALACAAAGHAPAIVSAGGTGDVQQAAAAAGVTEIQAGGGAYGDLRYRGEFGAPVECALTLHTTVISRPTPRRIVCDGGFKAVAAQPAPAPRGVQGVHGVRLNAAHTIVELAHDSDAPTIGERLVFDIGNADGTVFLHERLQVLRGSEAVGTWPLRLIG